MSHLRGPCKPQQPKPCHFWLVWWRDLSQWEPFPCSDPLPEQNSGHTCSGWMPSPLKSHHQGAFGSHLPLGTSSQLMDTADDRHSVRGCSMLLRWGSHCIASRLSSLCTAGWRPHILRGTFLSWRLWPGKASLHLLCRCRPPVCLAPSRYPAGPVWSSACPQRRPFQPWCPLLSEISWKVLWVSIDSED